MIVVSVVLSVFYDGQFYSAVFESQDETGCRAARKVFAKAPTNPEMMEFVLKKYGHLQFSEAQDAREWLPSAVNPKRRQREAAKAQRRVEPSTYAQTALKAQHEAAHAKVRSEKLKDRREQEAILFALRQQKKKEKHRGH